MPSSGGAASVVDLGTSGSISVAVTPQPAVASVSVSSSDSSGPPAGQLRFRSILFARSSSAPRGRCLTRSLSLHSNRLVSRFDRGSDYTIKLKTQAAAAGGVRTLPPFDSYTAVWARIMLLFAATAELRNSLAHRQLAVDPSSGAISATPRPGQPPATPATADEQAAFCQLATGP